MFQQVLAPFAHSLLLSALLAALPLAALFVMLGVFRVKAVYAALASLGCAMVLAIAVWGMPVGQALSATGEGVFYGLFPILWILVSALWVYNLTVATGWFDALGRIIRSISDDPRVLAILIAFCFGALLESLAGFEYNADCWIGRVVAQRFATAAGTATNAIFLQLELSGFSRLGSNPLEALRRNIPGYTRINQITDPNQRFMLEN